MRHRIRKISYKKNKLQWEYKISAIITQPTLKLRWLLKFFVKKLPSMRSQPNTAYNQLCLAAGSRSSLSELLMCLRKGTQKPNILLPGSETLIGKK